MPLSARAAWVFGLCMILLCGTASGADVTLVTKVMGWDYAPLSSLTTTSTDSTGTVYTWTFGFETQVGTNGWTPTAAALAVTTYEATLPPLPVGTYTARVRACWLLTSASRESCSPEASVAFTIEDPPPQSTFRIGNRIEAGPQGVLARDQPSLSSTFGPAHPAGDLGTITGGPQVAEGYTWWLIDYDTGYDGWSTEGFFVLAPVTPPPVNCVTTETCTAWSTCDAAGTQARTCTITIVTPAANGGTACPSILTRVESQACTPPPLPPQPSTFSVTTIVDRCLFTAVDEPPDVSGGWRVQFLRDGAKFGTAYSSEPFTRTALLPTGSYSFTAVWTKTGSTTVTRPPVLVSCK